MLKYVGDFEQLQEFGFEKFSDRISSGYTDRGCETGYKLELINTTYEIIESRKDWKWNGSKDIRILQLYGNDYDSFTGEDELDIVYDLIKIGLIEKIDKFNACNHCKNPFAENSIHYRNGELLINTTIDFCPKCGRKIE